VTTAATTDLGFARVFSQALRGDDCHVIGLDDGPVPLPVGRWRRAADASDQALLAHCVGHTLDVGCGPGRMSAHLMEQGHSVLGIDLVGEAVRQARERGVAALRRDVFAPLPGEGSWETVLLADGNIGIGGDPPALLARAVELAAPRGRVVVDLAPPGSGIHTRNLAIRSVRGTSRPFPWTVVGIDTIGPLAASVGLPVCHRQATAGRWFAVLERR
jgi:SAM-dependent methyltransferase